MSRLERIARRVARRGSLQQMDGLARTAASVLPSIREHRLMRLAAVTGDTAVTQRYALAISKDRATTEDIRTAVRTITDDPDDRDALAVLTRIRRRQLDSLAWLLFNQNVEPSDRSDALLLLEWSRSRHGADAMTATARAVWLEALIALGHHGRARDELSRADEVDHRFVIDASNPFVASDLDASDPAVVAEWLDLFNQWYAAAGLGRLALDDRDGDPYDTVVSSGRTASTSGPMVSVVISAFRPDHRLIGAVRSVLASRWESLEVLVFDDCSGEEYDAVLAETADLDRRVKVHRMPRNGGTYAIRNRALEIAQGEFITFHDSDDWAHPDRFARQAQHLVENSDQIANLTMSARVTERLELVNARSLGLKLCEPSLMFRITPVVERIGGFDWIRKAGDAEFRHRIEVAFGVEIPVLEPTAPLTLQLVNSASLSGGDISRYRVSTSRRLHRSCYETWHAAVKRAGGVPRIDDDNIRSYYAPPAIAGPSDFDAYDVEVLCDWFGAPAKEQRAEVRRAEKLAQDGARVALKQRDRLSHDRVPLLTPHSSVIRALNRGKLRFVE